MTRIVLAVLAGTAFLAVAGCGSPEDGLARQTEQYEVIDEGAVSGVTSTIHAPGDMAPVPPPTPDVTGTNLDTTTAFTILDPRISTAPAPLDQQTLPPVGTAPTTRSSESAGQQAPSRTSPSATPVRRDPEPAQSPRTTPTPRPSPTAAPVTPEPLPTPAATLPPQPEPEPEPETEPEEPEPSPPPSTDTSSEPDAEATADGMSSEDETPGSEDNEG